MARQLIARQPRARQPGLQLSGSADAADPAIAPDRPFRDHPHDRDWRLPQWRRATGFENDTHVERAGAVQPAGADTDMAGTAGHRGQGGTAAARRAIAGRTISGRDRGRSRLRRPRRDNTRMGRPALPPALRPERRRALSEMGMGC